MALPKLNEGTVSITIDDSDITGTFSGNTTYYLRASIRQSADEVQPIVTMEHQLAVLVLKV